MKKKKKKVNKKKFFSRIFLLLVLLFAIIFTVTRPNKKEIPKFEIAVIIDNKDITNELVHAPYINLNNVLYLSVEDVGRIFDPSIYFEAETRKVITTTDTKVAGLDVVNNTLEINGATLNLDAGALDYGENQYIPITELSKIYNIDSVVTEKTAVISSLNNELITVKPTKKIKLKEEMSGFSKTLKKIDEGEEIIYIEDGEKKNWFKVLTYDGKIGYIKNKNITEKERKREKMDKIGTNLREKNLDQAIMIRADKLTNETLNNFTARKQVIENIVGDIVTKQLFTINVNLRDVNVETQKLERFVIELLPRLRELGANLVITNNNNNILSDSFINKMGINS